MVVDGLLGEEELGRDVGVPVAVDEQVEHVELARRQSDRVRARRGTRAQADGACASLTQATGDDRRGASRAEALKLAQAVAQVAFQIAAGEGQRRVVGATARGPERGGGSDVNALIGNGFPAVNLCNGMIDIHTPDERIAVTSLEAMHDVTLGLIDAARQA